MKIFIFCSCLLFSCSLFAQKDRMFHSRKGVMFFDFYKTPYKMKREVELLEFNYSIYTLIYSFRYNIVELNNNLAIGANVSPAFGLGGDQDGNFGTFNIPLYVSLNLNAGATRQSLAEKGYYIGLGYEYTKLGVLVKDTDNNNQTSWGQPMLILGVRWFNGLDQLRDFSIKVGRSFGYEKNGTSFQLSWGKIFNY